MDYSANSHAPIDHFTQTTTTSSLLVESNTPHPTLYTALFSAPAPFSSPAIPSCNRRLVFSTTPRLFLLHQSLSSRKSFATCLTMCKWYCTSEGPSTDLMCLHCRIHYCGACLHGDAGKMESLVRCAGCGKKPRVQPAAARSGWKGESTSGATAAGAAYSPSTALKQASSAGVRVSAGGSASSSAKASPKKSPAAGGASIFDKLTDPSQYTGTHVHRFDADGHGRGLDGRDSPAKGHGIAPGTKRTVQGANVDLSSILRPDVHYSPATSDSALAPKSPTKSPKKAPGSPGKASIFDKLTDPSQYTVRPHPHSLSTAHRTQHRSGAPSAFPAHRGFVCHVRCRRVRTSSDSMLRAMDAGWRAGTPPAASSTEAGRCPPSLRSCDPTSGERDESVPLDGQPAGD